MLLRSLKDDRAPVRDIVVRFENETRDAFDRIRCPRCAWKPDASSRWCCDYRQSPEPPFESCGAVWNTFETAGRCPGCQHRWAWTSCLQCAVFSPHEEWYESDGDTGR
jgi:hypothetical protein